MKKKIVPRKADDFRRYVRDVRDVSRNAPGAEMPDGTIYIGLSPETGKPLYAMPEDAFEGSFDDMAVHYEELCEKGPHGYEDWRLPTQAELKLLWENRMTGGLRGSFNDSARYWADETGMNGAWQLDFSSGERAYNAWQATGRVRYVRSP